MTRALCAVWLVMCTSLIAHAQDGVSNRNAQAREVAERLGRVMSAEGLETILETRNVDLAQAYVQAFNQSASRRKPGPMPADVEAVIVRHYDDPTVGAHLRPLFTSSTRYQSRALFDRVYREWRSGKIRAPRHTMRDTALKTDAPDVEAPLLEWLSASDAPTPEYMGTIVHLLGERKYAPAVPVLASLASNSNPGVSRSSVVALLAIGTRDAIDAVMARLRAAAGIGNEVQFILGAMQSTPPSLRIPYESLRAAVPSAASERAIAWLETRKDLGAVPDVVAMIDDERRRGAAIGALWQADSPDAWKLARDAVERLGREGRIDPGMHRHYAKMLDGKIANPESHFAMRRRVDIAARLQPRKAEIAAMKERIAPLRQTDPARYVIETRAYLIAAEELERQLERPSPYRVLAEEWTELGHFVRFARSQPSEALADYAAGERNGSVAAATAIADTHQFALRDRARALAQYEKVLARIRAESPMSQDDRLSMHWYQRCAAAQVRYLRDGTGFSGKIDARDVQSAAWMLGIGVLASAGTPHLAQLMPLLSEEHGRVDAERVAMMLDELPASAFTLARTSAYFPFLPDARSVIAFLERHDPAGYAAAAALGLVEESVRGNPEAGHAMAMPALHVSPESSKRMQEAATLFTRKHRVTYSLEAP